MAGVSWAVNVMFDRTASLPPSAGEVQQGEAGGGRGSPGRMEICPVVTAGPDPQLPDLSREDFTTPSHLYSPPLGPEHTHTVIAAYAASISKNAHTHTNAYMSSLLTPF